MSKNLVAYFSASGVTAGLSHRLAAAIGAELYEIRPSQPYSPADLDWTNPDSRSSREMNAPDFRPALAEPTPDLEQYDTIYLGFPIWWYVAPTLINSFLESRPLTGKTIVPFATSGGSEMGETNARLAPSCPGSTLRPGRRFNADAEADELKAWAQQV